MDDTQPVEGSVHIFRVTQAGDQAHGHPDILGISIDGSQLALRNMQWVSADAYRALYKQLEEGLTAWRANSSYHRAKIDMLEKQRAIAVRVLERISAGNLEDPRYEARNALDQMFEEGAARSVGTAPSDLLI